MRLPEYMLTSEVVYWQQYGDEKKLPAGAFVQPLSERWVPKHILEDPRWRWMNKDKEVFCYTHAGIVPIPKDKIRKV